MLALLARSVWLVVLFAVLSARAEASDAAGIYEDRPSTPTHVTLPTAPFSRTSLRARAVPYWIGIGAVGAGLMFVGLGELVSNICYASCADGRGAVALGWIGMVSGSVLATTGALWSTAYLRRHVSGAPNGFAIAAAVGAGAGLVAMLASIPAQSNDLFLAGGIVAIASPFLFGGVQLGVNASNAPSTPSRSSPRLGLAPTLISRSPGVAVVATW